MGCSRLLLQVRASVTHQLITLCVAHLGIISLVGCDADESQESEPESAFEVTLNEDDVVVASVNGVPITKRRVGKLVEETGRPPEEVVERLVEFELLAAEAQRRGLARDRDVTHTVRKAMSQRYLEEEFEAKHTVADIPDDVLERAYQQNIHRFKHPKLRKVAHILIICNEKRDSRAKMAKAQRLAGTIAREARKVSDLDEFGGLAKKFDKTDGLRVRMELIKSPVLLGARLAKSFVDGAMALERIGEISPPIKTRFGFHVIYLIDVKAAQDLSLEEVHDKVAEKEHPFWLKTEFADLVETLRHATTVEGYVGEKRRSSER